MIIIYTMVGIGCLRKFYKVAFGGIGSVEKSGKKLYEAICDLCK